MTAKYTFTIDELTLQEAKAYAEAHGQSLDELVMEFITALARIHRAGGFLPVVEKMIGLANPAPDSVLEEARWEYLKQKHLRG